MSISVQSALKQAPKPKVVTGRRIAKSSVGYPPWARAEDAAGWLVGMVVVEPTAKMACATFNISYRRLREAQARIERNRHHFDENRDGNGNGTTVLSRDAIKNMIIETGPDLFWDVFTELTQPQLPLQAAE